MLPVLCLMDFFGVRAYLWKWDTANLKILLLGAMIGIGLGTLSFGMLSEYTIRLVIGSITVLFVLNNWLGLASRQAKRGRSATRGTFWGSVAGFASFLAHTGAPPVMMYLLPQQMDKVVYLATMNLFFLVTNAVKVFAYAGLGQFSGLNLTTSLVLAPLVPVGVWLGVWLQTKINHLWFYRIGYFFLLLTGIQLIYQGINNG